MTTTLIAALIVGLLSPVGRAVAWGVPFGLLSIGTVLVSFIGSAISVLIVGATANVLLRASGLDGQQVDSIAGGIGAAAGLLLALSSARRMREVRGLSILCQRLAEDDARPKALKALDRLLRRVERKDAARYASLVLMAVGPLTQASLWEEARGRLEGLSTVALEPGQAMLRDQALATCELQFGDAAAAQAAISRIARPADPGIEMWLVAMEALLLAVRGDSEGAAAKLGTQKTDDNPSLEASHGLVRAHIFASRGQRDAAREELERVLRAAGPEGLERALRPTGPASEIAQSLIDGQQRASQA